MQQVEHSTTQRETLCVFAEENRTLSSLLLHPLTGSLRVGAWAGETETDTEWAMPEIISKEGRRGTCYGESYMDKLFSLLFL